MKKKRDTSPVHVCMFHVDKQGYFVLAHADQIAVRGFATPRAGLDYFELAYEQAHGRGFTWSAGAMLHTIQLSPRILSFDSPDTLRAIVGRRVRLTAISGEGVHERAFRCADQRRAARAYGRGRVPSLVRDA